MKKLMACLSAALVAAACAFCLTACGGSGSVEIPTERGDNVIAQYMDQGYDAMCHGYDDYDFYALMENDDLDYQLITLTLTDDEQAVYDAIDVMDDNYDQEVEAWLTNLSGEATVTPLADMIPTDDELAELEGKTGSDLESMGYTFSMWDTSTDDYPYAVYDYPLEIEESINIEIAVFFEELGAGSTASDDTDNSDMTVDQVQFIRFS